MKGNASSRSMADPPEKKPEGFHASEKQIAKKQGQNAIEKSFTAKWP